MAPLKGNGESPGKLIFGPIKPLQAGWDKETYYIWGANLRNYQIRNPKMSLEGGGMASKKGPTYGWGHPNYIGVITVSLNFEENDRVFAELADKLRCGANIEVPTFNGRFSLGSGIAKTRVRNKKKWRRIQRYLLGKILELSELASETVIPEGTYWEDFDGKHPIKNEGNIKEIVNKLLSKL